MRPDFKKIARELADVFRQAAIDRLTHEDGCPEGEQIKAGIAAIVPAIYRAGMARAAAAADQWTKPGELLLKCGEMTAQEMRTAKAVADGIAAAIRAEMEKM